MPPERGKEPIIKPEPEPKSVIVLPIGTNCLRIERVIEYYWTWSILKFKQFLNWPSPKNLKSLRGSNELRNFCMKFVKGFWDLMASFYRSNQEVTV